METHDKNELCADDVFAFTESLLHNPEALRDEILSACNALVHVGEQTWWRCSCGAIRPDRGEIDIYCSKCGEFRHIPQRLSRSPWPLYVQCLMRLMPETWFDTLKSWMSSQGLLQSEPECQESSENQALSNDCPKGIVKSLRKLACIDEMTIFETGEIRGLQWIALPMMELESK